MTPLQPRRGAGARVQAPTATEALPPADEESWLFPEGVPAAPAPGPSPVPGPVPAPESAWSPEGEEPAVTDESPAPELGGALPTLTEWIEALEERLGVLEALEETRPASGTGAFWADTVDAGEVAALREAVAAATEQVGQQVSRLAAEVSGSQQRGDERFAATEARLAGVESLSAAMGALEHKLNELGRAQVVFQDALTSHPGLRSAQRSVEQLRRELTAVRSVLGALDARVQELQTLPAAMEEVAAQQFERLVSEMLSLPVDLEGLYREMDRIAERVTAREDTAALTAERVRFVAEAVMTMRQDLDLVVGSVAEIRQAQAETQAWRDGLERRLAALESPGTQVERLYRALARVVEEADADPSADPLDD